MDFNFETQEYKRNRTAYIIQAALEYFISLLLTDAFLAKILTYLGISDALIGIIASFISVAFVFQLATMLVAKIRLKPKKLVILFDTIANLLFLSLYCVPFLPINPGARKILAVASILLAYAAKYPINTIVYKWMNSFVSPYHRARFSANKEMVSLVSGIVFTAVIGFVVDKFESMGSITGAFLFIVISMLVISIGNFACFAYVTDEPESDKKTEKKSFKSIVQNTILNKNYRNVIIAGAIWEFARYFSIGFMGTFKTNDLMISVFVIQVINMAASFVRLLLSKPIAKYSDKTSFAKGLQLGITIAMVSFFINIFTTDATWYLVILFTVLFQTAFAGITANTSNICYSYVDADYITDAMAVKNCICGVVGFGASIIGGMLLNYVQANGNVFMGIPMYGQQLLSAISFVCCLIAVLYIKLVVAKQKVIVQ
ncbi:MAG: MFS transporter [Clostridia bacterium]|nr:MFS transporter [Clostridia bacterium]